jgi:hypothetical protein
MASWSDTSAPRLPQMACLPSRVLKIWSKSMLVIARGKVQQGLCRAILKFASMSGI